MKTATSAPRSARTQSLTTQLVFGGSGAWTGMVFCPSTHVPLALSQRRMVKSDRRFLTVRRIRSVISLAFGAGILSRIDYFKFIIYILKLLSKCLFRFNN